MTNTLSINNLRCKLTPKVDSLILCYRKLSTPVLYVIHKAQVLIPDCSNSLQWSAVEKGKAPSGLTLLLHQLETGTIPQEQPRL